jgi:hypothetical protein
MTMRSAVPDIGFSPRMQKRPRGRLSFLLHEDDVAIGYLKRSK